MNDMLIRWNAQYGGQWDQPFCKPLLWNVDLVLWLFVFVSSSVHIFFNIFFFHVLTCSSSCWIFGLICAEKLFHLVLKTQPQVLTVGSNWKSERALIATCPWLRKCFWAAIVLWPWALQALGMWRDVSPTLYLTSHFIPHNFWRDVTKLNSQAKVYKITSAKENERPPPRHHHTHEATHIDQVSLSDRS